jgi:hypothetical protein
VPAVLLCGVLQAPVLLTVLPTVLLWVLQVPVLPVVLLVLYCLLHCLLYCLLCCSVVCCRRMYCIRLPGAVHQAEGCCQHLHGDHVSTADSRKCCSMQSRVRHNMQLQILNAAM